MNPTFHRRTHARLLVAAVAFAAFGNVFAQPATTYPTKPVKIVVGFAAGGGSDFIARLLSQKLTERLGQTVIVENKPGAGGNLAADMALKSPADGYTLFLTAASYTVNPALYKLSFDPLKDMTPIAQLARGPFIIAVNPKVKATNLKEFVEQAKKTPGKLSYASAGNGSIVHMVTEYFLDSVQADLLHIPYKGTSPALTDTIAGQTDMVFGTVASTLPFVKNGQLRGLAVTTAQRLPALPNVPTVMEAGFPGFQVTNWHGLIGPKGLPPEIVKKLNAAINEALKAPGMDTHMASDGLTAAGGTPEEFGALLKSEIERWGTLVKVKGIKLD
ncbi:MAG: tripartite tricarboxylate transporter substrate binding protein [Rubrivivax sp.]